MPLNEDDIYFHHLCSLGLKFIGRTLFEAICVRNNNLETKAPPAFKGEFVRARWAVQVRSALKVTSSPAKTVKRGISPGTKAAAGASLCARISTINYTSGADEIG